MADIAFLNVDLDVESDHPLDALVADLGEDVVVLHHGRARGLHVASFETADDAKSAEATILKFCRLLENLSDEARGVWEGCCTRTLDIGFDSGDSPSSLRSVLHPGTVKRVAELGAAITVTIYARRPGDAASSADAVDRVGGSPE